MEQIVDINRVCLPENYNEKFFADVLKRWPKMFFVAEIEKEIVGYVMCIVQKELNNIVFVDKGVLASVAVLSKYRQLGIGRALVQYTLNGLVDSGIKTCVLQVRTSNTNAIWLYKELDFKVIGTLARYYADGEDAFLMSKDLKQKI